MATAGNSRVAQGPIEQRGPDLVHIHLKVVPGASKAAVAGAYGDRLKVRVTAPAESGKANKAVIALLASALDLPAAQLDLVRGAAMPRKTVAVQGVSAETATARLHVEAC